MDICLFWQPACVLIELLYCGLIKLFFFLFYPQILALLGLMAVFFLRDWMSRNGLCLRDKISRLEGCTSTYCIGVSWLSLMAVGFRSMTKLNANCTVQTLQTSELQAVQNASAHLITGSRRRDHITPILRQLHWLPVRQRVEFKLAMLVFKNPTRFSPTVPGR